MDSAPILPARLDWPSAIGNFILNFGTLDLLIFEFLETHLTAKEFAKARKRHLQDRLDRIAELLPDPKFTEEQRALFDDFRQKIKSVRELRNHIAHGHPLIRFDPETNESILTIFPSRDTDGIYEPDAKHLEFRELLKGLDDLNEVSAVFEKFRGTKWKETQTFRLKPPSATPPSPPSPPA